MFIFIRFFSFNNKYSIPFSFAGLHIMVLLIRDNICALQHSRSLALPDTFEQVHWITYNSPHLSAHLSSHADSVPHLSVFQLQILPLLQAIPTLVFNRPHIFQPGMMSSQKNTNANVLYILSMFHVSFLPLIPFFPYGLNFTHQFCHLWVFPRTWPLRMARVCCIPKHLLGWS
jgi:hypothetical protein